MDFKLYSPESQGISSDKILSLIERIDKHCAPHAMLIARHGKVISKCCWSPFTGEKHIMNSFAKSVNVLAVGMAISEKKLAFEDRPAEMFKELLPEKYDERVLRITVRDLLRMTSSTVGLSVDFEKAKGSWITHYFTYPLFYEPGTVFGYESGASFMLSAMVQKVFGKNVFELLNERIFSKMNIDARWDSSPEGITVGGWGLYLSLEDMAKLAELFMCKGRYNGEQLIDESWLNECTKKQIDIEEHGMLVGYGYQFWIGKYDTFLAFGSVGQIACCQPKSDTFLVIQSGCSDIQLAWLEGLVVDFFKEPPCEKLCENETAQNALRLFESERKIKPPAGKASGRIFSDIKEMRRKEISILQKNDELFLKTDYYNIVAGFGKWAANEDGRLAAYSSNKELVKIYIIDLTSCFDETILIRIEEGKISLTRKRNAVLGDSPLKTIEYY